MQWFFFLVGCACSISDAKTGFVPRYLLLFSTACVLVWQFAFSPLDFIPSTVGCLAGYGIFLATRFLSGKNLGLGDVWFAGFAGAVLGIALWFPAMLVSCALAFVFLLVRKSKKISFIPFLFAGTDIALVFSFVRGFGAMRLE